MVTTVRSLGLNGIAGYEVTAECFLSGRSARLRHRGASGRRRPGGPGAGPGGGEKLRSKISRQPHHRQSGPPPGTKKAGTVYDLPIFVGLLAADGDLPAPPKDAAFIGELSLTGALRGVAVYCPWRWPPVKQVSGRCMSRRTTLPKQRWRRD